MHPFGLKLLGVYEINKLRMFLLSCVYWFPIVADLLRETTQIYFVSIDQGVLNLKYFSEGKN